MLARRAAIEVSEGCRQRRVGAADRHGLERRRDEEPILPVWRAASLLEARAPKFIASVALVRSEWIHMDDAVEAGRDPRLDFVSAASGKAVRLVVPQRGLCARRVCDGTRQRNDHQDETTREHHSLTA